MSKIAIVLFASNPIKFKGEIIHQKEFTMNNKAQARAVIDAGSAIDVDGYFEDDTDFNEREDAPVNANAANAGENTQNSEVKKPVSDERVALIKDAILKLDPSVKTHWDNNGNPKLKALTKISGNIIQADELDYVWALINS